MQRREFLQNGFVSAAGVPLLAAFQQNRMDAAAEVLTAATASGQVSAAVLNVTRPGFSFTRHFGTAASDDAMFLLGSISKPICVTALMTLFDRGQFQLTDLLRKFIPTFTGEGRDRVTMQQLMTHVSGLPDQLADNNILRQKHAGLDEFVGHAIREPLRFDPGSRYEYSSMAILLATHVAQLISGEDIRTFVDRSVFQPLGMNHSAQGLGRFPLAGMVACQTEHAAPESGAGDPSAKNWDWNSAYWRSLGAPWGGTHASAPDLAKFLGEFLFQRGQVIKPETATRMVTNRNDQKLLPRGLGFNVGIAAGSPGCSEKTFGHTGSTGTLAWADPATETICVVLTSLPGRAVVPHPRELASACVTEIL